MIWFDAEGNAYAYANENSITSIEDDTIWEAHCRDEKGTTWDIVDGEFVELVTVAELEAKAVANERITTLRKYLNDTDYILIKINEASLDGDNNAIQQIKSEYAEVLQARKNARAEINQLQEEYNI